MKQTNRNADTTVYIFLALLLIAAWHTACGLPYNEGTADFPVNFNLFLFVASILGICVAATICFLVTDFLGRSISPDSTPARVMNALLVPVHLAAGAMIIALIYKVYLNENTLFPGDSAAYALRHFFPHPVYFAFMLVPALILYVFGRFGTGKNRVIRLMTALLISLLAAVYAWCPEPFMDNGGGILHVDAYTTTIINTARMIPFDNHHINIYGHHGIIYLPLVKLFGSNFRAVALAICVFTFISFMAASYAADVLIERDLVYFFTMLAVLSTSTLLTRRGVYFQINPHRLLFPMLALAFLAWESKHPKEGPSVLRLLVRFAIASLAFVWNFETGLFTAVIFAFCIFLKTHYKEKWISVSAIKTSALLVVFVVLALACAVGIVEVYNLAVGGRMISFRQFIYPLYSGTYNVNNLSLPLPSVGHLYFLQILLFGFTLLSILRGRSEASDDERLTGIYTVGIALSGFSSMIYFVNRPSYGNMSIAFIQMALLAGYAADRFIDRDTLFEGGVKAYRLGRYAVGCALFFAIFWISVEGVLYIQQGLTNRQVGSWNSKVEEEHIELISKEVPPDTFAYGMGVPQLYYKLGWDPQIYPTDFPDRNKENLDYIRDELADQNAVFTSYPSILPEDFTLRKVYLVGFTEYGYYTR